MWLTSLSIRRPVFVLMIVAALNVLGLRAVRIMQVELNPKVDFPFISILTLYPGAGPEEIETQVTKKIEEAVASVNGIKLIASRSQEGHSAVNIEFKAGVSSDVAASDVREKIATIRADLPTGAHEPALRKFDINAPPILYYGLIGDRPSRELRELADNLIKPRLSAVPGVAVVSVSGGDVREVRVGVHRERLEAYGLSLAQIIALLRASNLDLPAGHILEGGREYSVRVVGEFPDVQTIAKTRLRMPNGQTVPLSDIADVRDTVEQRREISRINGKDSVALVIQKTSDGNTVEVARGVREEITRLQRELPKDVQCVLNQDMSVEVEQDMGDVKFSLFLGAFLAVLVIFLFLRDLRGTFIIALSIPTSILATFLPMYVFGFTLNTITLLALSLVVGILVDDSIVVLENIHRHLARGEGPVEAAINGRSEIGLAAITITLVDVVVFLPIAFMEGITGQFFWPFGVTVACATLFSLFISFTLTPMLASRWYRRDERVAGERGGFGALQRPYHRLDRFYRRALERALICRGIVLYVSTSLLILVAVVIAASMVGKEFTVALPTLAMVFCLFGALLLRRNGLFGALVTASGLVAVFIASAAGSGAGRPLLLFRFAPGHDQGQVSVVGELPPGASLGRTLAVAKRVERIALAMPDVRSVFTSVGATSPGAWGLADVGPQYFAINLKLRDKRSLFDSLNPFAQKEGLRQRPDTQIAEELRQRLGAVPGATIKVAEVTTFYAVGRPLQVNILGYDQAELAVLAQKVLRVFQEEPGVLNADVSSRGGAPEQRVIIDRDRAAACGLSVADIASALRNALEGDTVNLYREGGSEYNIRVQFPDPDRRDTEQIRRIVVGKAGEGGDTGQAIRLSDVASVSDAIGPARIERLDRQRMVSVTAHMMPGYAPGNAQVNINRRLQALDFGTNRWRWDGENRVVLEEWRYIVMALGLAIILAYMLMAALFNNLLHPLVILFSLPQAMIGAMLGLMATGQALTVVAMTGIIMLVGLVTKNAILLVDYTNTLRARGFSRTQAILEAGPTRLRPILMTTIAMVVGMLPTALGLGRGAEFRAPLAIPVVGGLLLSTLLTLLVIPCIYTYFDDFHRLLQRRIEGCKPGERAVFDSEPGELWPSEEPRVRSETGALRPHVQRRR